MLGNKAGRAAQGRIRHARRALLVGRWEILTANLAEMHHMAAGRPAGHAVRSPRSGKAFQDNFYCELKAMEEYRRRTAWDYTYVKHLWAMFLGERPIKNGELIEA